MCHYCSTRLLALRASFGELERGGCWSAYLPPSRVTIGAQEAAHLHGDPLRAVLRAASLSHEKPVLSFASLKILWGRGSSLRSEEL